MADPATGAGVDPTRSGGFAQTPGTGGGGGGGRTGSLFGPETVTLTEEHKSVLRRLLNTPYTTPMDEILANLDPEAPNVPAIRQILVFNLPASAFPHNPSSWGDLITSTASEARHFRDILLMFSAIVSDESLGTSASTSLDPNAAQVDGLGGGHGAAAAAPAGPPGGGAAGRGGGGRGRGRGGGGRGHDRRGGGGGPEAPFDRRGEISDGSVGLMFSMGDRRFPKVIPCVEEIKVDGSETISLYRFFFFVFDPRFNFSDAFERMIVKNAALYGDQHPRIDQPYLQFARIRTTQDFIDHIVIPYLDGGLAGRRVPAAQRKLIVDRIAKLRDANHMRNLGVPLSDARHPANPARIFSKTIGFSVYLDEANENQRSPADYFYMGGDAPSGANAGADDEDMDDPELVVPDSEADGEGLGGAAASRVRDADEASDMFDFLDSRVGDSVSRMVGAAADGRDSGRQQAEDGQPLEAGDTVGQAFTLLEPDLAERSRQHLIGVALRQFHLVDDAAFTIFPKTDLVARISSDWFGRRLLNLPLLDKIRELNEGGAGADFVDPAQSTFTQLEIDEMVREDEETRAQEEEARNSGRPVLPADENDPCYEDGQPDAPMRRAEALKRELQHLSEEERPTAERQHVEDVNEFRDFIRKIRFQVMVRRREQHQRHAEEEVMQWLSNAARVNFRNLSAGEEGHQTYGGFLPETLTQRLSQAEFATFAAANVLLELRYKNLRELMILENRRYATSLERENATYKFRHKATNEFWDMMKHSQKLPPPLRQGMDAFMKLSPKEQWGEHVDSVQNLSSFGNMLLTLLSRYNEIFRGSSNQHAFMLTTFCHYGTFEYDWGIKTNLLLMGKGSAGKSYLFEVTETLTWPGTFASWSHTTDKAYSTGTHFSDQTMAMHEAPLSYIAVDKYGNSIVSDPILKDRLARQRSSTRSFTKDEQGNRVTKDELVMVMGSILMATNDVVPPDDSPLMQRFIVMAVNDFKRPDFNVGDQSIPLCDLVSTTDNNRQIHYAKLFSFYILILCKMIQAGILPKPSEHATEMLLKEILSEFTRRTHISTSQPRKRKQIADVIRLTSYAYVVHIALFSYLSDGYMRESGGSGGRAVPRPAPVRAPAALDAEDDDAMDLDAPEQAEPRRERDQRVVYKAFHPSILVREALPRLFTTDEEVVYGLTLLKFLYDPEEAHKILDAVVRGHGGARRDITTGEAFEVKHVNFRVIPNMMGDGGSSGRFASRRQRDTHEAAIVSSGGGSGNPGTAATAAHRRETEHMFAEDGPSSQVSPFFIDPRYVILYGDTNEHLYTAIARAIKHPAPPPSQVHRILKDYAGIMYRAHPAYLRLDSIRAVRRPAAPPATGGSSRGGGGGAIAPGIERPSLSTAPAAAALPPSRTFSANQLREFQVRGLDGYGVNEDTQHGYDSRSSIASSGGAGGSGGSNTDSLPGGLPEDLAPPVVIGQLLPSEFVTDCGTSCIPIRSWHSNVNNAVKWELALDEPTTEEPVVLLYKDPQDRSGKRAVVAVLVEYVYKEAHKDALLESIRHVLSNNTIDEGGRNFITALPYIYSRAAIRADVKRTRSRLRGPLSIEDAEEDEEDDDDDFGVIRDAEGEVMPQFCHVLHIERNEARSAIMKWSLPGTADSHALTHSSIRFAAPDDRESLTQRLFRSKLGLIFDKNSPMNAYFLLRHFQKNNLSFEETPWHRGVYSYLPEIESATLRTLTDSIVRSTASNVKLIANYPRDSVRPLLEARILEQLDVDIETDEVTRARLFHIGSDYVKDLVIFDPTTATESRNKEAGTSVPAVAFGSQIRRFKHDDMKRLTDTQPIVVGKIGRMEKTLADGEKETSTVLKGFLKQKRTDRKQQRVEAIAAAAVVEELPAPALVPLLTAEPSVDAVADESSEHLAGVNSARAFFPLHVAPARRDDSKRPREPARHEGDEPPSKRPRKALVQPTVTAVMTGQLPFGPLFGHHDHH